MDERKKAAEQILTQSTKYLPALNHTISAYWPFGSEVDCRPLCHALHKNNHLIGLPITGETGTALTFRLWHPDQRMVAGKMGILVPTENAPMLEPDTLFIPMLAFSRSGFRLGYGGGFFDRTLTALRAKKDILAIGLAYACQEHEHLPNDDYDARLNWIITEREVIEIGK